MHNWIRNSLNLHCNTWYIVLPAFPWFKRPFELHCSHTYYWIQVISSIILRVTVPDQYFYTKHPDLNITAREQKSNAGTGVPAYGEIFTSATKERVPTVRVIKKTNHTRTCWYKGHVRESMLWSVSTRLPHLGVFNICLVVEFNHFLPVKWP